jgi:hypothetical protein
MVSLSGFASPFLFFSSITRGVMCYKGRSLVTQGGLLILRHWPLDLIQLHSLISRPLSPTPSTSKTPPPLRLELHLSNPPTDKLNLPNGVEQCRTQWVNQVKEADFVRWRNTSRTTGLRKGEFDAGWDGIVYGRSPGAEGKGRRITDVSR